MLHCSCPPPLPLASAARPLLLIQMLLLLLLRSLVVVVTVMGVQRMKLQTWDGHQPCCYEPCGVHQPYLVWKPYGHVP